MVKVGFLSFGLLYVVFWNKGVYGLVNILVCMINIIWLLFCGIRDFDYF